MSEGNSIINFGDISKPAVVLIEKISEAIGVYYKPHQTRRMARAEADAEKIKAISQIEINELQQRALERFVFEEAKKQDNIESITEQALPHLKEDANADNVENDWIANFFDKCRLISDKEMQALWAKLLAGEANSPGSYSKRTIDLLSSLDKANAVLFNTLCGFVWMIGEMTPLIYDEQELIYLTHKIKFDSLKHLDEIGLVSLNPLRYRRQRLPKYFRVFYYGTPINIELPNEHNNELDLGKALLTKTGEELAIVCGAKPIPNFLDYVLSEWIKKGLIVSSSLPSL